MAAEDYFPDLEPISDAIEREMSEYSYTRHSKEGTLIHKAGSKRDIFIPNQQKKNKMAEKEVEFVLPELDEITDVDVNKPPVDLVIVGIPKIGKGNILGDFTRKYKALVWGLEKGGYEYIPAR